MFFFFAAYYKRPVSSIKQVVNNLNDEAIAAALKQGDAAAMDTVITKYSKLLWSIASPILSPVSSVQDIEECVADVFIYLWQNPQKFDPCRGTLKVWLSIVTRSQAVDRYRRLARLEAIPLDDTLLTRQLSLPDDILLQKETRHTLWAAVRALKEPEQEMIVRRYYYGQKPREIARALGFPVKSVENRLYRAKQALRSTLRGQLDAAQ